MTLLEALKVANLVEIFQAAAQPDVKSSELLKRLKADERLKGKDIAWPKSLKYLRETLNCRAAHGGRREVNGKPFVVVSGGKVIVNGRKSA